MSLFTKKAPQSIEAKKFNFEQAFDKEAIDELHKKQLQEEKDKAERIYKKEDLQAAEEQGYNKGLQEGKFQVEGEILEFLNHVKCDFQNYEAITKSYFEHLEKETLFIFKYLLETLFQRLSDADLTPDIEAFIKSIVHQHEKTSHLNILAHPNQVEKIQSYLEKSEISKDFKYIKVHSSDNHLETDCTIEWDSGGIERKFDEIKTELSSFLDRFTENFKNITIKNGEDHE